MLESLYCSYNSAVIRDLVVQTHKHCGEEDWAKLVDHGHAVGEGELVGLQHAGQGEGQEAGAPVKVHIPRKHAGRLKKRREKASHILCFLQCA